MAWEFESDRPIYTQLLEMIQIEIISGKYAPGDKLPSVRELAMTAGVNPNTVQRALMELERKGLLITQRTTGRTVIDDREMIKNIKKEIAMEHIQVFLETMKKLGYTKEEIIKLMEDVNL